MGVPKNPETTRKVSFRAGGRGIDLWLDDGVSLGQGRRWLRLYRQDAEGIIGQFPHARLYLCVGKTATQVDLAISFAGELHPELEDEAERERAGSAIRSVARGGGRGHWVAVPEGDVG